MNIVGWIRQGDKAACGGTVLEGLATCTSGGVPYSFEGAHMACHKNCVIAQGFSRATLANGRSRAIHGMKTSGGCPLYSSLNDIDGVGNEGDDVIAEKHFLNADGDWTPIKQPEADAALYNEQTRLDAPPIEGVPYYIATTDGRIFSGRTALDGLLPRIDTYGADEYAVYWGDEALVKMKEDET